MPGRTPYRGITYPLVGEVIDDAVIQQMAADMNTALQTTLTKAHFSRNRSSVAGGATGSPTAAKNVDTWVASFATPDWDTGARGPGATPFWSAVNPGRFTAPVNGCYFVTTGVNPFWPNDTPTEWVKVQVRRSGTTIVLDSTQSNTTGVAVPYARAAGLLYLTAGQYLEFGLRWSSAAAGPLTYSLDAEMALMVIDG